MIPENELIKFCAVFFIQLSTIGNQKFVVSR